MTSRGMTVVWCLLVMLGAVAPAAAQVVGERDAAMVAEAYHLWESLGDSVWSGWTQTPMPMVFVAPDHEFAIGFDAPPEGFAPVAQRVAGRNVSVRTRTLEPATAASYPVGGVPAVVIGPAESLGWTPTQWALKAAHEMYHVLSMRRGSIAKVRALDIGPAADPSWQLDFPFPYGDVDVMRLMHLEGYALYLGISASDDDADGVTYDAGTALEALAVMRDYLRGATGDDRAADYAMFQEAEEGAGRYTEYRLARLAAESGYEPAASFRALAGYVPYNDTWEGQYRSAPFVVKHAGRAVKTRTLFYYTGLGKCLLLDRIDPDWKDAFFAPGVWLDDLIAAAVGAHTTLNPVAENAPAPDFTLEDLDGVEHALSKLRGHPVLLSFWQWWCPPCILEMPYLQALAARYRDAGLVVLGVSDRIDAAARDKMGAARARSGARYPSLIDPSGAVTRAYGVNSYPMTVLIDTNGVVRWVHSGFSPGQEAEIDARVGAALDD